MKSHNLLCLYPMGSNPFRSFKRLTLFYRIGSLPSLLNPKFTNQSVPGHVDTDPIKSHDDEICKKCFVCKKMFVISSIDL